MWIWIASAWAAAPDREVAVLGNDTAVSHVSIASDGSVVAAVSGAGALVASTDSWQAWTTSPCTVKAVAAATDAVWCGCDDGSVVRVPVSDTGLETADPAIDLGEDVVLGVWLVDDTLWALTEGTDAVELLSVVSVDTTTNTADLDGAFAPPYRGYVDGLVSNGSLYLLHGTSQLTSINLSTGAAGASLSSGMGPSGADLAPAALGVYAADSAGSLWQFSPQSLSWTSLMYSLGTVSAVGSSVDDGWVGVVADDEFKVWATDDLVGAAVGSFAVSPSIVDVAVGSGGYTYAAGSGLLVWTANPWIAELSVSPTTVTNGSVVDVAFTVDRACDWSVHRGGDRTGSGGLLVEGHAEAAGEVATTFTVDGQWEEGSTRVYVLAEADAMTGHARASLIVDNPPDAPVLHQRDLTFGDGSLTVEFEGLTAADIDHYEIYVTTTPFDGAAYETGGPPFDGTDALLTPIRVSAVVADDATVANDEPVAKRISPLTNGTTYYVAVRTFDQGGLMSPMSNVVQGVPQPSFSASELAGDEGGPYCATSPAGALATAFAALLVTLRRRAAVALLLAPGVAAAEDGAVPFEPSRDLTLARGDFEIRYGGFNVTDPSIRSVFGETGNQMLQTEFGIQPFNAWAASGRERKERAGQRFDRIPNALGFLEFDVGVGYFKESDREVAWPADPNAEPEPIDTDEDGNPDTTDTDDDNDDVVDTLDPDNDNDGILDVDEITAPRASAKTTLTLIPLTVDATVRLQLLDEQIVVPFVRGGLDYVLWTERSDDGSSAGPDKAHGAKTGMHYGGGIAVLLDPLAPARASLLEAQSGINDTYIVLEWRKQVVEKAAGSGDDTGMSFSGTMTTFGLKMDF